MSTLHSPKDDELEKTDKGIFSRVVLLAGIVLLVIIGMALLLVRQAGKHIRPVNPDPHPTSQVVMGGTNSWIA